MEYRNKDEAIHKKINQIITITMKQAKEIWLEKECDEIEILQEQHDNFNLYKKIKRTARTGNSQNTNIFVDYENKVITEIDDGLAR